MTGFHKKRCEKLNESKLENKNDYFAQKNIEYSLGKTLFKVTALSAIIISCIFFFLKKNFNF